MFSSNRRESGEFLSVTKPIKSQIKPESLILAQNERWRQA
jgi:hypothetical protein